jgi:hypothetical protein
MRRTGYKIIKEKVTPIPFDLVLNNKVGDFLNYLYYPLAKFWKRLFGYQLILLCKKESLFTSRGAM